MIPSDIRLYTWVDVEEVLLRLQEQENWPNWLVWARPYWDGLTMGIRAGNQKEAQKWLSDVYEPRFRIEENEEMVYGGIILESLPDQERILKVFLEETDEEPITPRLTPSLSRPGVVWPPIKDMQYPEILPFDLPPVVAFHSFKGGVGRTTHALALAQALATAKHSVLLVDGDIEAPGISWIFESRFPSPPVCYADLLALVHGDISPDGETVVNLVADRLSGAMTDDIYILPSFRSNASFSSLEIRPEHLMKGSRNPFILTNILASLGKALGVKAVIVDLRAGLSELSTGLILDPRVYRVFVTTLSAQSVAGTKRVLQLVGERSPSKRDEDPLPAIIINQVPQNEQAESFAMEVDRQLLEAAGTFLEEIEENRLPQSIITDFADSLVVLPQTWQEVKDILQRSGIVDDVGSLMKWLPLEPVIQPATIEPENSVPILLSQREKLRDFTQKLVYAERAEAEDFLQTNILQRLASDFRRRIPIAVIVGAKGSGKTYTFLQINRRKNWQKFVQEVGEKDVQNNAFICPVLRPRSLEQPARDLLETVRRETSEQLEFSEPCDVTIIRDYIRDNCKLDLHEGQWRDCWLDVMAWGVGFGVQEKGAGRNLAAHLAKMKKHLVFVIDGLEDFFQKFASAEAQQTALRALLQEVPEWLAQQPDRPVGILVFIRRDMVLAAIHQNAAQMMALYEPYALKWNRVEALRLVAWVANHANILEDINVDALQKMGEEELNEALIPLWGKKLGSERSKEANSVNFVIAALSDFKGQIQARDLVRLLYLSANASISDSRWQDRILVPTAIKGALPESSQKKIEEIEIENNALKDVFTKLRILPQESRQVPFTRDNVQLSPEEMKLLEDNGVVIREQDQYYMPEIFRYGLGFSVSQTGRPKVIALARRAAQRS